MSNQFPWWDQWDTVNPDAFWATTLSQLQESTAAADDTAGRAAGTAVAKQG
jgi:hypothetical protein